MLDKLNDVFKNNPLPDFLLNFKKCMEKYEALTSSLTN